MPDDDKQLSLDAKPAEMSFSDWKKMKNALNSSTENKSSRRTEIRKKPENARPSKVSQSTFSRQNNSNNNYNRGNNVDYRQQQNLQYFESLNQNNGQFINNPGNIGNQMLMMQALNNIARHNNVESYNSNMGAFHRNNGPFHNNTCPPFINNMSLFRNNTGSFNSNNSILPTPLIQQGYRGFTDNYMGSNNNFESMSDVPIPQLPYTRTQKRGINGNKKNSVNKSDDSKPNADIPVAAKTTATQKKPQKQKREWIPVKPAMPPPLIAFTPEAQAAKQRMWREYRQKIKPFKNKDFLNAKRVIQRLKKKPFDELDEKEKDRWEKANEFVNSHKKMLTEKAMARGEAASARATRVQETLNSEKNSDQSPASVELSSPSNNYVPSSNNVGENSNDPPPSSEAAGASNSSENWELWNSFVPGGVIFKS